MSNINYISSIVKILETPKQIVLKNNNSLTVTKFRVQLPQKRKPKMINLIFWGHLAQEVQNSYKINDYIMVEGYLSLKNKNIPIPGKWNLKKVEITVLKIYPFISRSNHKINNK